MGYSVMILMQSKRDMFENPAASKRRLCECTVKIDECKKSRRYRDIRDKVSLIQRHYMRLTDRHCSFSRIGKCNAKYVIPPRLIKTRISWVSCLLLNKAAWAQSGQCEQQNLHLFKYSSNSLPYYRTVRQSGSIGRSGTVAGIYLIHLRCSNV